MKKILCLALVAMMVLAVSVAGADHLDDIKAKGKLVVGSEVGFAPFEFWFTGEDGVEYAAGFEMELAREIASVIGVELEISDMEFTGVIPALRAGDVDLVISGMTATDERRLAVDFSETYYVGEQPLVVREADVEKYKTFEDVKGKTIGAQTGSIQATIADEQFIGCEILNLPKVPTLLMELLNGNIEGVVCSRMVANQYMKIYSGLAFSEVPVVSNGKGVGVAMAKDADGYENASLMALVNDVVNRVVSDGTYDKWVDEACELGAKLLEVE